MHLFIIGTVVFSIFSILFSLSLALWTYADAKVKSEESPVLWLLFVLLINPIGIITYLLAGRVKKDVPAPGKYKKFLIISLVGFILSTGLFTVGVVNFVTDGSTGIATVRSGSFSFSNSRLRDNVWTFTARSANGHERRSPNLSAQQLANFHVRSDSGENLYLHLEQDNIRETIDISGSFDENIDMSAFQPGRVRITLDFNRTQGVDVEINWQ
ncbi:MAG: PLDc N-terminal domain-containing protein [Defluviitaleaceae bacterium]|nr:PLDc N-terminal domain-containing protein [Defluviitaleaceae bacterium]